MNLFRLGQFALVTICLFVATSCSRTKGPDAVLRDIFEIQSDEDLQDNGELFTVQGYEVMAFLADQFGWESSEDSEDSDIHETGKRFHDDATCDITYVDRRNYLTAVYIFRLVNKNGWRLHDIHLDFPEANYSTWVSKMMQAPKRNMFEMKFRAFMTGVQRALSD